MVKTPFHKECIEKAELCEKCSTAIKSGLLSDLDLEVSKFLLENNRECKAEFVKSISEDNLVTLLIRGSETEFMGADGSAVNNLSKALKKKIKLLVLGERVEVTISRLYGIVFKKTVESHASGAVKKTVYIGKHELSAEKLEELKRLLAYLYRAETEIVVE